MAQFRNFDELNVSTSTIMAYSNLDFDMNVIFENMRLTQGVVLVYTKKQHAIDMKKTNAPYGSIISIQKGNLIRGVNTRKPKKRWCTICRPTTTVNNREKEVLTCVEVLHPHKNDIFEIRYYCNKCDKTYKAKELNKIGHFLNQTSFYFSVGEDKTMLHVMIFKDSFKIAGSKDEEDVRKMMQYLWAEQFSKIPQFATLKNPLSKPSFTIVTVMKNVGFDLGFGILREPLNILMNDPEYSDKIYMSEYESTGHTNVKIKMFSQKPDNFKYIFIEFENFTEGENTVSHVDTIFGKKPAKKKKGERVTFIVFSSSQVILTGKYTQNMRELYNFFRNIIIENRELLEEVLLE